MLIEAAWSNRRPARISREQLLQQEALPKSIRDVAWKALHTVTTQLGATLLAVVWARI